VALGVVVEGADGVVVPPEPLPLPVEPPMFGQLPRWPPVVPGVPAALSVLDGPEVEPSDCVAAGVGVGSAASATAAPPTARRLPARTIAAIARRGPPGRFAAIGAAEAGMVVSGSVAGAIVSTGGDSIRLYVSFIVFSNRWLVAW
jgi:hypothetical protein